MRIDIRISAEQKANWVKMAREKGLTLTRFIVDAVEHSGDIVHTNDKSVGIGGKDGVHTGMDDVWTEGGVHTDKIWGNDGSTYLS